MLATLAQTDPEGALESIDAMDLSWGQKSGWHNEVFGRLAAVDPAQAAALLETTPKVTPSDYRAVGKAYAKRDPHAAIFWAGSLEPGQGDGRLIPDILWEVSKSDVSLALEFAQGLDPGTERLRSFSSIVSKWVREDLEGALSYAAENLTDAGSAFKPLGHAAGRQLEAAQIRDWAEKLGGPVAANTFLASAALAKSRTDPAAALALAEALPDGIQKAAAYQRLGSALPHETAANWIEALPPSLSRDAAVGTFSTALAEEDAAKATRLAAGIEDDYYRTEVLDTNFKEWLGKDPVGAEAWARENPDLRLSR